MAGFKTHIGTSTVLGVGYGAAGSWFGMPLGESILSASLCSVAGMLPDLDSDSGVPIRETFCFLSALVPMMLINRLEPYDIAPETLLVIGIIGYVVMRFGVSRLFRKYTVHRGMWHSIPAAAIAGLIVYLLTCLPDETIRLYRSGAVVAGFLCHLVLDEIWSIEMKRGRLRFKKSFGTAMKLWSRNMWANLTTYAKLAALVAIVVTHPAWLEVVHEEVRGRHQAAGASEGDSAVVRQAERLEETLKKSLR